MGLARRNEVPEELKWDLSLIYKTEEDMYADLERAKELARQIVVNFKGKLDNADAIVACVRDYEKVNEYFFTVSSYTNLAAAVDFYDTYALERDGRINNEMRQVHTELSFVDSEIAEADETVLKEAIEKSEHRKTYLQDILANKPHRLNAETEKALTALSGAFAAPNDVYGMIKQADMQFPSFSVDGKEYAMVFSLFEDNYEYEADTKVRRTAFAEFSKVARRYENTCAAAYNAQVTREKAEADLRGFDNVFDFLLFGQKATREMFDRQVDLITERLAPHMRRYAKLIQAMYGLDEMTFADLKLPLDPGYDPQVNIEQAHDYVKKGLAVLGTEYGEMIDRAFKERWFDFARNQGKTTGGFCASPYGRNSFILLSWNERMSDVFTIAHELGHAGHFQTCNSTQSLFDTDVSSYLVEAPSTMNEVLMVNYLLKTSDDKRFRRWVLSSFIGNTYYHNFVTHLREAWYQREVYNIIEAGGTVNAPVLCDIFKRNLETFWGDAVKLTEGAELTWMRQQHYYMGLYSYTYSAGLTVATQAALRIEKEGKPAVDDWKKLLALGGTIPPAELAKVAGIDISTDQPLNDTIDYIGSIIDEICRLTEELDGIRID